MSEKMQRRLADNIATDNLSCPICKDPLQDPKLLPCDHTLCCECLTQLIHLSRRYNKFLCPVDRQEITAPSYDISAEEWANSFPTDELAIVLLQAIAGNTTTQGKAKHAILCTVHPHNVCEFYCFGCYQIICSECAVENHRSTECNCKKFKNCADLARKKLGDASDEIENLISKGKEIVNKEIEKDKLLLQSRQQIKDTVLKLESIVDDFKKMVNRKCRNILNKIERQVNVEELQKKTEEIVKDLEQVRDEIEYSKSQSSTKDMLTVLSNIPENLQKNTERFESLGVSNDPIKIKLELNETFLNLCDKLVDQPIGTVHVLPANSLDFEDTEAMVCSQRVKFSSNVLPFRALELQPFLEIKVNPIRQKNQKKARFTGLIHYEHAIIAIDNANCKVQRFRVNVREQFIDEISIQCVYAIANIYDDDDVLVTAPGKQSYLFRLSTYKGLSIVSKTATDQAFYDISRLPGRLYAVICHASPSVVSKKMVNCDWSRGATSHIDIIDVDGNVLTHLRESRLLEPSEFGDPIIMPLKNMCCLPNGAIVVSTESKTNNLIACITQNRRIKWTHSLNDTPEGVCFHDGRIFVFLRESKVVRVLSVDGDLKPVSTFRLSNYFGDGNNLIVYRNLLTLIAKTDLIQIYKLQ